jgi:hypothetical protein
MSCTPDVILIRGGLTASVAGHATIGAETMQRDSDETADTFEARAVAVAKAAGVATVIIGGLLEESS